ncbi:Protein of unknown function [Pyronema omphalodes CBS 100304]|uniref:Uncharacterized protein n=1 Tax=Pyronema omphalodes (strain CBS 100304) TaxID=1076935 RepID=U4LGY0_PYROM|nr:Protein of unknown function [Pyronema omphalodes CBS 100304]
MSALASRHHSRKTGISLNINISRPRMPELCTPLIKDNLMLRSNAPRTFIRT